MSLSRDHSRADDLVQETLLKACKNRSAFVQGTNLKAWLITIVQNTFLSECRKRKLEVQDSNDQFTTRAWSRAGQEGHMNLSDLATAFELREALILIGTHGHSYNDAALMCGCAVGTAKSRVNRARRKLPELLGVEGVPVDGSFPSVLQPKVVTSSWHLCANFWTARQIAGSSGTHRKALP